MMDKINEISNIYQLLAFVFLSFFTIGLPILLRTKKIQKERFDIDKKQSIKIDELSKKINEISDNLKNIYIFSEIEAELNKLVLNHFNITNNNNKELKDAIRDGISNLIEASRIIIFLNFSIKTNELKELLLYYLRKTKYKIKLDCLNITDLNRFLNITKIKMLQNIDDFLLKYEILQNFENGQRLNELKKNIIEIANNSIRMIITEFNLLKNE